MSGDAERLARLAERAACRAATYLARVARPPVAEWGRKGPADFVTVVDRTAEAMIRDDLLRAEPDSTVLGEELAPSASPDAGLVWIVDPLDGTTNFLHGYPAWSVSIGAAIDGEVIAGAVLNVAPRACAIGWRNGGAWSAPSDCGSRPSATRASPSSAPDFRSRRRTRCRVSLRCCPGHWVPRQRRPPRRFGGARPHRCRAGTPRRLLGMTAGAVGHGGRADPDPRSRRRGDRPRRPSGTPRARRGGRRQSGNSRVAAGTGAKRTGLSDAGGGPA